MYVVPGFSHTPGQHCGSTALANLTRFYGHPLSEAMCFGLGAGLGFIYVESLSGSPGMFIGWRTPFLEMNFFHSLGLDLGWQESHDFPWPAMRRKLDEGLPVLTLTDLYYLPQYGNSVHFPGHAIVVCGYQDEDTALVADTNFPELVPVPLADLAAAMRSKLALLPLQNNWLALASLELPDLAPALRTALAANATAMLRPPADSLGLAGMQQAAAQLRKWGDRDDWQWCARFAYQMIERRGTGGGAFRRLYAAFLAEAGERLPALRRIDAAARMADIAAAWTGLGQRFKAISAGDAPPDFEPGAEMLADLARREEGFFRNVLKIVAD